MTKVKITSCQLELKPFQSFQEFEDAVMDLTEQVPDDADYVVFPELVTAGLVHSFSLNKQLEKKDLVLINEYTDQYKELFRNLARDTEKVFVAGSHLEKRGDKYFNIGYVFDQYGNEYEHKKTHIFPAEINWSTSEGSDLQVLDVGPAKIGLAICYEAEIPEVSRILGKQGADIIFSPSYTFTEAGFYRVRHCAQARCIENQVYFVHCPTIGNPGEPLEPGFGRSSILSPCDLAWNPDGVVAEAAYNQSDIVSGEVDIAELYKNRKDGAATTVKDRERRKDVYEKYEPYKTYITAN
ncbi:nitrilase-related carbon-nitrogen hydrolase [Halobacillus litoralis]|uniref:nitrilase-related carbon-nitrogen hydrolase n=1 Tax=Halobacillus litoralis TaxID=45668 RepID=UPI00248FCF0E|nr:nitrilase-related carbon-nitrogen hydrolase [Halobacillus litoralis]